MSRPQVVVLLRWLLVLPATFVAFAVIFRIGMRAYVWAEERYCTPGHYWNGMCYDASADVAIGYVYTVCAAVAPLAVGVAAVATAPSHKLAVAWTTWFAGSALLVSMAVDHLPSDQLLSAGLSGLAGVIAITAYLRRARRLRPDRARIAGEV